MNRVQASIIISTAKKLLENGVQTKSTTIQFPVTPDGSPFCTKVSDLDQLGGEMCTMYTRDGEYWIIQINDETIGLGSYPDVYCGKPLVKEN